MTREEAIETFEEILQLSPTLDETGCSVTEAMKGALSALRPVSRERVEKLRGILLVETSDWDRSWSVYCSRCNSLVSMGEKGEYDISRNYHFCPMCMTPLTDEAVEMVMERLEALKNGEGNNVPTNEPLTIEELRKMDGEPVWVEFEDGSGGLWGIVHITIFAQIVFANGLHCTIGERYYGKSYKAYRRPPEGEA